MCDLGVVVRLSRNLNDYRIWFLDFIDSGVHRFVSHARSLAIIVKMRYGEFMLATIIYIYIDIYIPPFTVTSIDTNLSAHITELITVW